MPGARKAGLQGEEGGAGTQACAGLPGLLALRSQTERGSRRRQLGGEIRSRAGTQDPGPPPAGRPSPSKRKAGRRTIVFWKRRNWDFCFGSRTGQRAHTMPSVETPRLEGRTVAHLGKVRSDPSAGSGHIPLRRWALTSIVAGLGLSCSRRSQGLLTLPSARVFMWKM